MIDFRLKCFENSKQTETRLLNLVEKSPNWNDSSNKIATKNEEMTCINGAVSRLLN